MDDFCAQETRIFQNLALISKAFSIFCSYSVIARYRMAENRDFKIYNGKPQHRPRSV